MKYLVLLGEEESGWDTATPEQRQAVMDAHTAFHKAVAERATMLAGEALAASSTGRTLRHVDGEPLVTDGPYTEGVEQLAGFYLVEAADLDEAIQIAAKIPPAREGTIEVRPVRELRP